MKIWVHVLTSSILALVLFPIAGWKAVFIIAGGVLFDIDHYFWYIYKFKKFSILKCYRFYNVSSKKPNWHKFDGIILVFHTLEFLLAMAALSLQSQIALLLTLGLLLHNALDVVWYISVPKYFITDYFLTRWICAQFAKFK